MKPLNLVIITQDDPFGLPHFFNEFFKIFLDKDIKLHGVVIQAPLGKSNLLKLINQMYAFYGPHDFFLVGLRYVFYRTMALVAEKVMKGKLFGMYSVRHVLMRNKVSVFDVNDLNSRVFHEILQQYKVDLVLSVAASQKLKKETLGKPTYGVINIHNAKLPKNRGMLPNFWSLLHYDKDPISAMTVHKMNEELDDGDIILQEEFKLDPKQSLQNLIVSTKKQNAYLALKAISLFKTGPFPTKPNDKSQATYNTFPNRNDVRAFRAKGLKLR